MATVGVKGLKRSDVMSVLSRGVSLYSKYFKVVQGHVAPSRPADARVG